MRKQLRLQHLTPVNPFVTQNNDTINSLPMVVGQNNSILPIVVEPIAQGKKYH